MAPGRIGALLAAGCGSAAWFPACGPYVEASLHGDAQKKDGLWRNFRSRLRLSQMVARFFHKAGWAMLQALWPGYHPDKVNDPAWIANWRPAYAGHAADFVPLLNTLGSSILPEFEQSGKHSQR